MTFPRKRTRRITVGEDVYLWHLDGDDANQITIRHSEFEGQFLFANPWCYEIQFGAGGVRKMIDFALANGWQPKEKGAAVRLTCDERGVDLKKV
ncbi:MAG: hypothetical protein H8F28_07155 [Fibrella sp.]|nr:hypothetical protein [Armatimonadota bacterium]